MNKLAFIIRYTSLHHDVFRAELEISKIRTLSFVRKVFGGYLAAPEEERSFKEGISGKEVRTYTFYGLWERKETGGKQ